MHGFFIDFRLYEKAKAIVNPFAYEDYRKDLIKEKIAKETSTRITKKNIPKVNALLATKLQESSNGIKRPSNLLTDPRFEELFSNTDFEIDQESQDFRRLNPSMTIPASKTNPKAKIQLIASSSSSENEIDPEDEEFGIRN